MTTDSRAPAQAAPLWRVASYGRQLVVAGQSYWWDNGIRFPPQFVFQYTVSGSMSFRDSRGVHPVPAGTAVLFAHGDDTAYGLDSTHRGPYSCEWVHIAGAGADEHWRAFRDRHGPLLMIGERSPLRRELGQLLDLASPKSHTHERALALAAYSFVANLFFTFDEQRRRQLSLVERAVEEILARPFLPWSLKEVAHRFKVSREHLTRAFSAQVGESPHAWLSARRGERALTLLRDTDLGLTAISDQSGFSSVATMTRQVRALAGCGPSAYRRRQRRD